MVNYDEEQEEVTQEEEQEEEETQEEETEETEDSDEEEVDYKAKWEEAEAARKKAEQTIIKAKSKPKAKPVSKQAKAELSTFDLLALQKADIDTQEDLDEVVRWADYNSIPVAEALKSNILKATLAEKAELRTSAQAVNTGSGRRASGQVSDERLMTDANKGIMPSSEADMARLARLRFKQK